MVWSSRPQITRDSYSVSSLAGEDISLYDLRTRQTESVRLPREIAESHITDYVSEADRIVLCSKDRSSALFSLHALNLSGSVSTVPIKEAVICVRSHREFVCVVCEHSVIVLSGVDMSFARRQDTFANPGGCCDISQDASRPVMCCPGLQRGTLRIQRLWLLDSSSVVAAHESALVAIAVSGNGAYVSSVSEAGSLIRVHSTIDACELLFEIRRSSILSPPRLNALFMSPSGSFVGTVDENSFSVSLFRTSVAAKDHLLDPARTDSSPSSLFQSISTAYRKCVEALPGGAAWAVVKIPTMNSRIVSLTAGFGPDPYTLVAAAQTTSGVAAFIYRFDPDEPGTVTLARCETLTDGIQNDEKDETGLVSVSREDTASAGPDDWIFLDSADSQLETRVSWYPRLAVLVL